MPPKPLRKPHEPRPGWVAEPVRGGWEGRRVEVVYDPSRHEIAFLWQGNRDGRKAGLDVVYEHRHRDVTLISSSDGEGSERVLEALGWEQRAADGQRGFWTRDRLAAARTALERLDQTAGRTELTGPRIGH